MKLRDWLREENRIIFIALCVILMITAIFILGESVYESRSVTVAEPDTEPQMPLLAQEAAVFRNLDHNLLYLESEKEQGNRSLSDFYRLRAYDGAPPMIPHELLSENSYGGRACLQCHETGGYVARWQAFAPVTPHPELTYCRQCHVPQVSETLFKNSRWRGLTPPPINVAAMDGSPPPVPHALQMRENCIACHAGPAAPKDIRTTHADRAHCLQCHALVKTAQAFVRPAAEQRE